MVKKVEIFYFVVFNLELKQKYFNLELKQKYFKIIMYYDDLTKRLDDIRRLEEAKRNRELREQEETRKRKAAEEIAEMVLFLLPPKSAKDDYVEQKPAKYVFECMDGEIQIPEYGLLRTDFYYQVRIT